MGKSVLIAADAAEDDRRIDWRIVSVGAAFAAERRCCCRYREV